MIERIKKWLDSWWNRITEFLLMSGVIILMVYVCFLIAMLMIVVAKNYFGL